MKKLILFGVFVMFSLATFAQAPQGINYQAVVRNANNQILSNATVGVSISLRQTVANGPIVYQEHFTTTTTTNGLINLVIGTGTVDQGAFNSISWGQGPYFAEIGIDQTGGTNYNSIGTQQLMSVPYALYAETAGNPGPQGPIGLTGPQGVQGPAGTNGQNGIGISSTIDNGNGTFTFNYTDGSSFTTGNLTGLQGAQGPTGMTGATGPQGPQGIPGPAGTNGQNGVGISSTINNGNGTYTFNYTDGSSFTTSNLTGPQGATGLTGATGPQGPSGTTGQNGVGISSTINNGNGTYTFNYTDGSSFTTSNLTGPQGPIGLTGATGPQGPAGINQVLQSNYTSNTSATSTARNTWVTLPSVSISAPSSGNYLMLATGRLYTINQNEWAKFRIFNQTTNTAIAQGFLGYKITANATIATEDLVGSVNKVTNLNSGDIIVLQYWVGGSGTSVYNFGGDLNGESGLTLIKF